MRSEAVSGQQPRASCLMSRACCSAALLLPDSAQCPVRRRYRSKCGKVAVLQPRVSRAQRNLNASEESPKVYQRSTEGLPKEYRRVTAGLPQDKGWTTAENTVRENIPVWNTLEYFRNTWNVFHYIPKIRPKMRQYLPKRPYFLEF